MSTLEANLVQPSTGTDLTLGASGDTITIPSGATITNSGTATGFGGDNTPAFQAYLSTTQTISHDTWTKVECQTEDFDTGTGYDNSSTYLYTVPSGEGGVYWIYFYLDYVASSTSKGAYGALQIRVNSETNVTASFSNWWNLNGYPGLQMMPCSGGMRTLSAGDTIGFYAYGWDNDSNNYTIQGSARRDTRVGAYKMLGIS